MKNLIGFLIIIILGLIVYFIWGDTPMNNEEEFKDYAIEDTASIDQIFISQMGGKSITLSRRGSNTWMVKDEYPARPDAIQLILKTAHDIEIQQSVKKNSIPTIVKRIASSGIKVEFYQNNKNEPTKTWYIGGPTASRVGTYMILEKNGKKSSKPIVTHLIMERGYLGTRFFTDKVLWKDRIILKSNPRKIERIEVIHKYDTATSFIIAKKQDSLFEITNKNTNQTFPLNPNAAIQYFKKFKGIYYEYIDANTEQTEIDSIYNSEPRHQINVTFEDGKKVAINTFNMPVVEGATLGDQPIDYNPERMYAWSNTIDKGVYPVVQNYTFNALTPSFENFASLTTVEK